MIAEARIALSKINTRELLISPHSADRYVADLQALVQADKDKADAYWSETMASVEKMYGYQTPRERTKPFVFNDGVAVIPVHGILINRFSSCWGFATGYNFIRAQMNAANADEDVKLIVFDIDSGGGDAAGCFELTEDIRALDKATLAVVDDIAASGGYAIAAAPDKSVCTPSGQVGSIGVYRLHIDVSGANTQMGIKYTYVFSGDHKVDGNPYEALSDEVKADWQKAVDQRREEFVADISLSRDLDAESVRATEARVYRADEGLALGLLDAVSTPTQAVSSFLAELANDTPEEEDEAMALDKNDPEFIKAIEDAKRDAVSNIADPAQAAKDAVAADRKRRSDVMALDEAKSRPKLAAHLADTTEMDVDAIKGILAVSAEEKAAPKGKEPTNFAKAMDKDGGAGVASEDDDSEDEQVSADDTTADNIMAFIAPSRRIKKG